MSLERVIVRGDLWGEGIARSLVATAVEHVFSKEYEEIRTWIMTDKLVDMVDDWRKNYYLFRSVGFQPTDKYSTWLEWDRLNEKTGRDALWLRLSPKMYEEAKSRRPVIKIIPLQLES